MGWSHALALESWFANWWLRRLLFAAGMLMLVIAAYWLCVDRRGKQVHPEMGVFARSMLQCVYLQVLTDQAAIACVLERTRLTAGAYPASLAGHTLGDGRPLPLDACNGRPMHCRQTDDGRYVLWSEGLDGRDDHAAHGTKSPNASDYKGDWVWGYSATP